MGNSHNSASTFRPYDASKSIGDLSPITPKPPKHNKCGAFGQILLVAIAVAVTVVTSGAAAAVAASASGFSGVGLGAGISIAFGGTAAGVSATALGVATFGAIGAAAGSLVSQAVGVATGIQDKFNWKGVALSALSGGIGGGLANIIPGGGFLAGAARGAAGSALTQGIGLATGLQSKFDWAGVAAAGLGSGIASAAGIRPIGPGNRSLSAYVANADLSMANSIANAATRSLLQGTDFGDNILAGLPDVLGSTIGNMVAFGVSEPAGEQAVAMPSGGAMAAAGSTGEKDSVQTGQGGGKIGGGNSNGGSTGSGFTPAFPWLAAGVGSSPEMLLELAGMAGAPPSAEALAAGLLDDRLTLDGSFAVDRAEPLPLDHPLAREATAGPHGEIVVTSYRSATSTSKRLSWQDYQRAGAELGRVDPSIIYAIGRKEAPHGAYLPDGRVYILFEPAKFQKFTNHRFDSINSTVSNSHWGSGTYKDQYRKLEMAMKLDPTSALRATSFGQFQILGDSYDWAGYKSVQEFAAAMQASEQNQLAAFVNFAQNKPGLLPALRSVNFDRISYLYNGANYIKNNYNTDLRNLYLQSKTAH